MIVLVTGASGFIGRYCCKQLSELGYEVHAVSTIAQSDKFVFWHKLDLFNKQAVIKLLYNIKPTHLLHLAWYAVPNKYWASIANYHWVNVSLILFEEFIKSGGKRILVSGSCAEYDWSTDYYKEDKTPLKPETLYGTCKHSLHLMLSSYAKLKEFSFVWGRIFLVYGPHEAPEKLFSSIIQALLNNRKITCQNGELIRDYLHVSDVASALVTLLFSDIEGPVNIGSGIGLKLKDIAKKIEEKTDRFGYLKVITNSNSLNQASTIIADTTRLNNIQWKPFYTIENGLDDTISWLKKIN